MQGLSINSAPRYPVKMKFFTLAVRAGALQNSKFTGIATAAPAVIGPRAGKKLGPAVSAEVIISFADVFAAVNTNRRPKKMV